MQTPLDVDGKESPPVLLIGHVPSAQRVNRLIGRAIPS